MNIGDRIAIPTRDNVVDDHFGHCDHESCSHYDCVQHEEKPVFIIPNIK